MGYIHGTINLIYRSSLTMHLLWMIIVLDSNKNYNYISYTLFALRNTFQVNLYRIVFFLNKSLLKFSFIDR